MIVPFARIVNQRMNEKKMGIRELARAASLDASFFSKVLSGKRNPPSDEKTIVRIARILDLDPEYLVFTAGRIPSRFQAIFLNPGIIEYLNSYRNAGKKKLSGQQKEIPASPPLSEELL